MNYPELHAWAADNGFSTDELALIQMPYMPSYPVYTWMTVGGINTTGTVTAIKVDEDRNVLYVAATFDTYGYGIASYDGINWNYLGNVTGTVNVITVDVPNIVIGGSFTAVGTAIANNVAIWNGSNWSSIGSGVNGAVKTAAFLNNNLYAGGSFTFSGSQNHLTHLREDGRYGRLKNQMAKKLVQI